MLTYIQRREIMTKGIIFNIQKFSIHDGPGIRTTVFLKGCPLRCQWCSNPESQNPDIQILYNHQTCLHCLHCISVCPQHAISYNNEHIHIDFQKCIGCLQCTQQCPSHSLTCEGEYQEVQEIVRICKQDLPFYEESNGGVTISGGEGMGQPQFVEALLQALKAEKIHVAIETTGYIQEDIFHQLAPQFDLLLFDVKHYDSHQHLFKTGVPNELIIQNLTWAIQQGIDVLPRIPVIPDFNCTLEDAEGFVKLFQKTGIKRIQLLPFHQFGEKKYEMLNQEYLYQNKKALHPEDLKDYQQIFINHNIDCFI